MKKYKILLMVLLILIFTGCTGNYNVNINNDLSVSEELKLEINNNNDEYNKTLKIFRENKIDNDKYKVSIKDSKVIINYKEKFNSINDYVLNSKVYHQMIDEIKFSEQGEIIDIYINEKLKIKTEQNNIGNDLNINKININIKNPFKVITSNEDEKNSDTYTWVIKNEDVDKKILMQFKMKVDKVPYRAIITAVALIISILILAYIIIKNYKDANKI